MQGGDGDVHVRSNQVDTSLRHVGQKLEVIVLPVLSSVLFKAWLVQIAMYPESASAPS